MKLRTDLQELLALPAVCMIDGKEIRLRQLTLSDIGEVEAQIISQRKLNPAVEAAKAIAELPEGIPNREKTVEMIMAKGFEMLRDKDKVTAEQLEEYLCSFRGRRFVTYLQLRHDKPDITREESDAIFETMHEQLLMDKVAELIEKYPTLTTRQAREALLGDDASALYRAMHAQHDGLPSDPTPSSTTNEGEDTKN